MTESQRADAKRARHSATITKVLQEVDRLQSAGWTAVFTDGASKGVGGWDQAGYGYFYGDLRPSNLATHVLVDEPQSNNKAEGRERNWAKSCAHKSLCATGPDPVRQPSRSQRKMCFVSPSYTYSESIITTTLASAFLRAKTCSTALL